MHTTRPEILSVRESPAHPDLDALYRRLGLAPRQARSVREAIRVVKKHPPTVLVGEFFYGWGNNYAGVNVSNLDVLLASLPKYAPDCRVVVLVEPAERQFVDRLAALFPVHATLVQPVDAAQMEAALAPLLATRPTG